MKYTVSQTEIGVFYRNLKNAKLVNKSETLDIKSDNLQTERVNEVSGFYLLLNWK